MAHRILQSRPIYSRAPVLVAVKGGRARIAAAGSGGYRIQTGVLHTFMNAIDHRMGLQAAIDVPRVHCQGDRTYVDARVPEDVRKKMEARGHDVVVNEVGPASSSFGNICAVSCNPGRRTLHAGADAPWRTGVAGY